MVDQFQYSTTILKRDLSSPVTNELIEGQGDFIIIKDIRDKATGDVIRDFEIGIKLRSTGADEIPARVGQLIRATFERFYFSHIGKPNAEVTFMLGAPWEVFQFFFADPNNDIGTVSTLSSVTNPVTVEPRTLDSTFNGLTLDGGSFGAKQIPANPARQSVMVQNTGTDTIVINDFEPTDATLLAAFLQSGISIPVNSIVTLPDPTELWVLPTIFGDLVRYVEVIEQ